MTNKPNDRPSPAGDAPMTIAEARQVMWLRNYHRPLGELLDEGYLTQARLEWAAARAYDPQLKQAARVLLAELKQSADSLAVVSTPSPTSVAPAEPVQLAMPLERARATLWPYRAHKGQPMGPLSDSKQLSLRDLVNAIETAWDDKVRRAAMTLLVLRLDQAAREPTPPAGVMQVVSGGRSYSERRRYLFTALEGMFVGAGMVIGIALVIWGINMQLSLRYDDIPREKLLSLSGLLALAITISLGVAVFWLVTAVMNRVVKALEQEIANNRQGQEGEERVVEAIRQSVDGNWRLFRNVELPGRNRGDIDAVLVGPCDVWALEIKAFNGEYRNIGDRWEYRHGSRWRPAKSNPSRQAKDNAARLGEFLKADKITQWVTPAVVWASEGSPVSVENPMTAVWLLDHLPEELGNLTCSQPIPAEIREKILDKLAQLCKRQESAS